MKVVFINCYFNHHQKPFSDALVEEGIEFAFIETMQMPEHRKLLKYQEINRPEYVFSWLMQPKKCEQIIDQSDVVLFSSAPEKLFRRCFGKNKVLFRVTERPLKRRGEWHKFVVRFLRWHWRNPSSETIYLLSASAYAPRDYRLFHLFQNRAFKWGYFPDCELEEDIMVRIQSKVPNSLIWVGRFLDWKHPENAIYAASELKKAGHRFYLTMVGTGPMHEELRALTEQLGLSDCICFLGPVSPERVRNEMKKNEIFLLTSDRHEGWGAVLNEAMNSGCAVVASHLAGATPYLINPGINGLVYHADNVRELSDCIDRYLTRSDERVAIAKQAYDTIMQEWNAKNAAHRFKALADQLKAGHSALQLFSSGPCSPAQIIQEDWFCENKNS